MGMARVVAYEKTGVKGKRLTASSMGTVSDMGEEVLSKLVGSLEGNRSSFDISNVLGAVLQISGN
jgi:hypothetical protein